MSADRRARVVTARAISDPPPAPGSEREEDETAAQLPSLHDYDEAEYPGDIHDPVADSASRARGQLRHHLVRGARHRQALRGRSYARFYALETVARVPYFSFLSVLHLYETLGFWRRADYLKVHFAQTMNEFHHLLIMESMGGDERFTDRFFAQHMAVFYYFIACAMYLVSPRMAYNLSEQVEEHAYHTYDEFLRENESELKSKPRPPSRRITTPRATSSSSTSFKPVRLFFDPE